MRAIPGNGIGWRYEHTWSPDWTSALLTGDRTDRETLCGEYAWAIPDPPSLQFLVDCLAGKSVVEMGAGTGYWAWQLSQLGVDILAYDHAPPQLAGTNRYHSPRTEDERALTGELRSVWFDVQAGEPECIARHGDRVLLLCWPPYSDDMAVQSLKAYTGTHLIYIGESDGGCTADEAFFELLTAEWEEVATHRPVQWWGIHDWITVYERKPPS